MQYLHTMACCVSTCIADSARTLELSKKSNLVLPFIGIHPEMASDDLDHMEKMINENSGVISGIGEIGLDKGLDIEYARQKVVFEKMLSLAERHAKPVSIHSRKSLDDVLSVLASYSVTACLHWFDGNKKQLQKATDMGLYVSYGPVMVYANDKQSLLSRTEPERILVETDGPVRFSGCFGFRAARPDFIPSVIFAASKVLKRPYEDTGVLLEGNSRRFLGI